MGIKKTCKCLIDGSEKLHPCSSNCHLFGDCVTAFCKANTKPFTNADHIRAMSDEELAKVISPHIAVRGACNCTRDWTEELLDWLKQPHKEEKKQAKEDLQSETN